MGKSIFFELNLILFSDFFALDIMYFLYENILGYMFDHWIGNFYINRRDSMKNMYCKKIYGV